MKKTALVLAAAMTFAACRPDTVALSYRYPEAARLTYRMTATAHAEWDIGGAGKGSYEVTFSVTETVESVDDRSAEVFVVMVPTQVEEQGLPSPGSEQRSFSLRIDERGRVLEVLEVQGVPALELSPDQLAFIGTYRPLLPDERKRLSDEWEEDQQLRSGSVFQEIDTLGRLVSLDRDDRGKVAGLEYEGQGPLLWNTNLPQGEAEMQGTSTTSIDALLDLDRGLLREATSRTRGDFRVTVLPTAGAEAITGTLHLDLDVVLERT